MLLLFVFCMVFVFLYFTSIVMSQLYMYVCYVLIKYQSVNQY